MVYIFLAEGFEAIETITPVDMLIRAQIPVRMISVTGDLTVSSSQGIKIQANALFEDTDFSDAEMLIIPGGQPGATNLCNHKGLEMLIRNLAASGKPLAAICAGPTVLGRCGILKGRKVTVYPGYENELEGAECTGGFVEKDGNIITAIGAGAAIEFSKSIITLLRGREVQSSVCAKMQLNER
jgi:protein deglycase